MAAEDWKDSNIGAIGTDEDKALRKMAATKEPAWAGAGSKPGLLVWRVEHFHVVPVDPGSYGKFHKGDSYIVLQTVETDSGKLVHTIYFYIGTESSIDEKGTAAYKTVELDDLLDGEPKQVREEMGKESPDFVGLFKELEFLDGGVDSGFKHVVPEGHDTKLYQIRRVKGKTTVLQVPARKEMLNDGDSFVLDAPEKIYVLDGPKASPFEKRQANETAEHIETSRPQGGDRREERRDRGDRGDRGDRDRHERDRDRGDRGERGDRQERRRSRSWTLDDCGKISKHSRRRRSRSRGAKVAA